MLDALDLTRLHELEENGVQTQASLGRKLGAAKATIRRREHRLLNRHAVRLLGLPNLSVLGCDLVASKGVNVDLSYWQGILAEFIADYRVRYLAVFKNRPWLVDRGELSAGDDLLSGSRGQGRELKFLELTRQRTGRRREPKRPTAGNTVHTGTLRFPSVPAYARSRLELP